MASSMDKDALLLAMAEALDGARTWLDNIETGSHAAKLPAVDVLDYMPNNVPGRPRMFELAEKARLLASQTQHS
jgi:hypothetical protein